MAAATSVTSTSNGINAAPTPFTLHVSNLPPDMEKDGVTSIFSDYGEVTGVIIYRGRNNTNQGYVSFPSFIEAENAINNLDRKLPLMLRVQFRDKRASQVTQEKPEIDLSGPIVDHRYKDSVLDNSTLGKKLIEIGKANCKPGFRPNNYTSDTELLYPVPDDPLTFNPYERQIPYQDTNLMYTRGTAHVTSDGRRRISYGRGYTFYTLPEHHYNIGQYLEDLCERREKGIYEYADDENDDSGTCRVCNSPTAFKCQKCAVAFYCSKPCQVNDWPKHKNECQPIPPLVKRLKNKALMQNGHDHEMTSATEGLPREHDTQNQKAAPLRLPRSHPQQSPQSPQRENANRQNRDQQQQQQSSIKGGYQEKANSGGKRSPARSTKSNVSHHSNEDKRNDLKQSSAGNFKAVATSFPANEQSQQKPSEPQQKPFQNHQQQQQQKTMPNHQQKSNQNQQKSASSARSNDDNISFQSNDYLSRDKFVQVMITTRIDDGDYWVQKLDDGDALIELCSKINKHVETQKPIKPEENVKCLIKLEDGWYRATIIALKQPVSKVFLHDFGTISDVEITQVCPLDGFENIPLYSRHIRIAKGQDPAFMNLNCEGMFEVKAVSVEADGTIIVQAANLAETADSSQVTQQMANISINESRSDSEIAIAKLMSLPNVMDKLEVGKTGLIIVHAELAQAEFNVTIAPENAFDDFESLLHKLKAKCLKQVEANPQCRPNVGDLVCGLGIDNEWYRGVVLTNQPVVKLAAVDESRVFIPVKCTPWPEEYHRIPSLGFVCSCLPNTPVPEEKLTNGGNFTVDEVSSNNNTAMITMSFDDVKFTGKALIKKWIPRAEQKGIQWGNLKSGEEVKILHFSSQNIVYVRSEGPKEKERCHLLDQKVAKYALNRQPLTETPVVGLMVLSHYTADENYYRAIVTKVEGANILVRYVDYGNDETTKKDKLFKLPDDLKEEASCVIRIKLKNVVTDVALTSDATIYFEQLILNQIPLTCTFTGNPLEDGVLLKEPDNSNVNDKVQHYIQPSWEKNKPADDKKVWQLTDLPEAKLGDVGDDVKAITLIYYVKTGALVLGPNDYTMVEAIQVDMQDLIMKYVETVKDHYIPRENELCIAKYDDVFYRGLCLDPSATPTESRIFFIDFGNTDCVKHTDIRLFTKDFASFPPFGVVCNIIPTVVPVEKFNERISKRIFELLPIDEEITIKIIGENEDGTPNIDVPAIRVKLIEEGLI